MLHENGEYGETWDAAPVRATAERFTLALGPAALKTHVPTIALTRMLISVLMRPMHTSQSSPRGLKASTCLRDLVARGPARAPPTSIKATATIKKRVFILVRSRTECLVGEEQWMTLLLESGWRTRISLFLVLKLGKCRFGFSGSPAPQRAHSGLHISG